MAKRKLPDVLTREEQIALLGVFNMRYHSGRKNRLMVELMLTIGLRISEVCSLKWSHLRLKDSMILIKAGKGDKDRNLHVPHSLMSQIKAYKQEAPDSEYVFATRNGQPVDRSNMNKMVKKYAEKAGIDKRVYNHLLRHTALTDLYSREKDIRLVQDVAGHANIQTTQIYTHVSAADLKEALTTEKY